MAEALMVNHVEMAEAASRLKAEWDNMTESINNVTNTINDIPNFWKADTADRYMEQYSELKPGLDDAVQLISDLAEQMTQISTNFQDTDSGMAGKM